MTPANGLPFPLSYNPINIVTHSKPEAGILGKFVRVIPRMYSSVASSKEKKNTNKRNETMLK